MARCLLLICHLAGLITACGGESEINAPGTCALRCSNSVPAAPNYVITSVFQPADITCVAANPAQPVTSELNTPIRFLFQASGPRPFGRSNLPSGADADAGAPMPRPESPTSQTAPYSGIGGLGFTPVVSGVLSAARTDPSVATVVTDNEGVTTVNPFEYAGIVTPRNEWCSDTCGVIAIDVWPVCVAQANNVISVGVRSGQVNSPQSETTVSYGDNNNNNN